MATTGRFEYAWEATTPPVIFGLYAWASKFAFKVEAGGEGAAKLSAKRGAVKLAVETQVTQTISAQIALKASTKTGFGKALAAIQKGSIGGFVEAVNFFEGSVKGKSLLGYPVGWEVGAELAITPVFFKFRGAIPITLPLEGQLVNATLGFDGGVSVGFSPLGWRLVASALGRSLPARLAMMGLRATLGFIVANGMLVAGAAAGGVLGFLLFALTAYLAGRAARRGTAAGAATWYVGMYVHRVFGGGAPWGRSSLGDETVEALKAAGAADAVSDARGLMRELRLPVEGWSDDEVLAWYRAHLSGRYGADWEAEKTVREELTARFLARWNG